MRQGAVVAVAERGCPRALRLVYCNGGEYGEPTCLVQTCDGDGGWELLQPDYEGSAETLHDDIAYLLRPLAKRFSREHDELLRLRRKIKKLEAKK